MADQVHQAPSVDSGVMPCCGRSPFKVPITDRLTIRADLVTCVSRLEQAIDIVARHVIASSSYECGRWWDVYDEIGENDWQAVAARVQQIAPFPDRAQYEAAYEYLAGRAEGVES